MTVNFALDLHPVLRNFCLPTVRQELLSEILEKKSYGAITRIWHHSGHVFITTDEGRKLFTFDCRPDGHGHNFDTSYLDIVNIPSAVIDICMTSESIALVVAMSGHVRCWKFTKNFDWSHLGNFDLCLSHDSSVVSLAYMKAPDKIIWCERQKKNLSGLSDDDPAIYSYSIKLKQFSPDLREMNDFPTNQLIYNCPPCVLMAMTTDFLFIQTQPKDYEVTVTIICTIVQEEITLFLGNRMFPVPKSKSPSGIDFSSVLMSHMPALLECETGSGVKGLRQCFYENRVASLGSRGCVEVFSLVTVHGNEQASRRVFELQLDDPSSEIKHWFLCSRHIGIICDKTLLLYSLKDGDLKYKWESNDLEDISFIVPSSSPSFLTWILNDDGLFSLQRTESRTEYSSPEQLPQNNLLQTDILRLAYLHQLKLEGYNKDVVAKLQELKLAWSDGKTSHQVQIAEKIEPLIDEYMRLESLSKSLKESKKVELKTPEISSIESFIEQEMARCKTASKVESHSKLLWLSSVYPQQLLAQLTKGITLESEIISEEMPQWQHLLDLDGHDLSKFEIVCRLLFVLHPEKLVFFVKSAETVNEHKIGVTAFMRKKHTLIFYKKACDCLPPAETSHNPSVAAVAKATLILCCKESNSEERALKYLLAQGLWSEAVSFLKTGSRDKQNLPCNLFITVSALASNQVLSEFLPDLFEIMPSWKSFLTFAKVAMERPEIREQQLSSSAADVFQQEETDICIADIKPYFLQLLTNMNIDS